MAELHGQIPLLLFGDDGYVLSSNPMRRALFVTTDKFLRGAGQLGKILRRLGHQRMTIRSSSLAAVRIYEFTKPFAFIVDSVTNSDRYRYIKISMNGHQGLPRHSFLMSLIYQREQLIF